MDLAIEAAKKLTYALVDQQPVGPFDQVGDDQLIHHSYEIGGNI
jgi:hypothetical protein